MNYRDYRELRASQPLIPVGEIPFFEAKMDYKDTLNLPTTSFPMKANLPQREPEILKRWEEEKTYHKLREIAKDRPKYILHDGPPYANGHIHIGTALNTIHTAPIIKSNTLGGTTADKDQGRD